MFNECRHIKTSGAKCKAPALRERAFCFFHWRLRTTGSKRGRPRKSLRIPSIEDPQGIQIALTQVLGALGSPSFDKKDAGRYLYGLQIASQLAARASVPPTSDLVRSLSNDDNGEILAPETTQCDPGAECDSCATRDQCVLPARIAYLTARHLNTQALKDLREREQRETAAVQPFSQALAWASEPEWQGPPAPDEDEED
jgi:hypothetical protein